MNFREQVSDTPVEAVDPRYAIARDAAIQSFRNRLGRDPSPIEFRDSMPLYMTNADRETYERERAVHRPYLARGIPTPPRFAPRALPAVPPPPTRSCRCSATSRASAPTGAAGR